jgi:diadenosine tetraphosphatase ApaH/serine/threonine PP2A family protein phosphatase
MRTLILSDIHANLPALQAVLADAGEIDAAWCLGDLVGYGPEPNECVELVSSLPNLTCLLGNHDSAVLGQIDLSSFNRDARTSIDWTEKILTPATRQFLQSLPERVVMDGSATLAHGSPRSPVWEYLLDTYNAYENFAYFETPFCFVGHTHIPVAYYWRGNDGYVEWQLLHHEDGPIQAGPMIVNPGSTGQPRDHDSRAAYLIFNPDSSEWKSHRVTYDITIVQERIRKAGLPDRHATRLASGW